MEQVLTHQPLRTDLVVTGTPELHQNTGLLTKTQGQGHEEASCCRRDQGTPDERGWTVILRGFFRSMMEGHNRD